MVAPSLLPVQALLSSRFIFARAKHILEAPHHDDVLIPTKEKQLKGDERKLFMKSCLSSKKTDGADAPATPAEPVKQQDKMKACNKDAGDKQLKGDERKKFMSDCLKK